MKKQVIVCGWYFDEFDEKYKQKIVDLHNKKRRDVRYIGG